MAPNPNTPSFVGAEASAEAQKRALLAAVAQQGQAGQQQFQASQAAQQAARAGAVSQAATRATSGGIGQAPAGLVAQMQGSAAGAVDPAIASTAALSQGYSQELSRIGAASGAYADQVRQAIPINRQVTAAAADQRVMELEDAAKQRAHDEEMRKLEIAEARRKEQEAKDADVKIDPVPIDQAASVAKFTGAQKNLTGQAKLDYARQVAQLPAYATMEATIQSLALEGASWPEVDTAIRGLWGLSKDEGGLGHPYPDAYALLKAQYEHQFNGTAKPTYAVPSGGARTAAAAAPAGADKPAASAGPLEPLDPSNRVDAMQMRDGKKCKMKFPDGQYGYTSAPCPGGSRRPPARPKPSPANSRGGQGRGGGVDRSSPNYHPVGERQTGGLGTGGARR